jgi:hypothetical protein
MRVGETFRSRVEVFDSVGAPASADSVTVTITRPNGAGTTGPTSGPTETAPGSGVYDWSYLLAEVGTHRYSTRVSLGGVIRDVPPDVIEVDDAFTWAPLVSLARVKTHLNIDEDDTSSDDELRETIAAASAEVERASQLWHVGTVVEVLPAARAVFLSYGPIRSVTSVAQGGVTITGASWRVNATAQLLPAAGSSWIPWSVGPAYYDDLTVTYEAGTDVVPQQVREAVLLTVEDWWGTQRGAAGLPLEGEGTEAETLPPSPEGPLPWAAQRKLGDYARTVAIA